MMSNIYKTVLATWLLAISLQLEAHTGAAHTGTLLDGAVHLFTSLDHLLPLLLGVWAVFRILFLLGSSPGIEKDRLDR